METAYLIFYVRDQRASAAFYRSILARAPRLDVPGMTEFALTDSAVLGLMPQAGIRRLLGPALPDPASAGGTPRAELYLLLDDPAPFIERARQSRAREISPFQRRDWGHDAGYFLDPDGHVVAFARVSA